MYIYIITVLCILLSISFYIIINLYKKNSVYEAWVLDINDSLVRIKNNWRELDSKQMFEKDDEVGTTFSEIDDLVTDLNQKVINE